MEVSFDNLKYLVTVVADDLLNDDFGNFQNCETLDCNDLKSDVSEEMYDKVRVLVMKSIFGEKAVISIMVV